MSFKFLVSLYEKINELEEKRSSLIDEMKKKESPTEERERLLRQVSFYFVFFLNNSFCFCINIILSATDFNFHWVMTFIMFH